MGRTQLPTGSRPSCGQYFPPALSSGLLQDLTKTTGDERVLAKILVLPLRQELHRTESCTGCGVPGTTPQLKESASWQRNVRMCGFLLLGIGL